MCEQATPDNVSFIVQYGIFSMNIEKLSEVSDYFSTMFNGRFKESEENIIRLEEVGFVEFCFFYRWMKNQKPNFEGITNDFLFDILIFADRFLVEKLVKVCHEEIQNRLHGGKIDLDDGLKLAFLLEDKQLKKMLAEWFQKAILKRPIRWTLDSCLKTTFGITRYLYSPEYRAIVTMSKQNEFYQRKHQFILQTAKDFNEQVQMEKNEVNRQRFYLQDQLDLYGKRYPSNLKDIHAHLDIMENMYDELFALFS